MGMNKTGEEVVALLKEGPLGLCRTLDLMLSMMGSLGWLRVEKSHGPDLYSGRVPLAAVLRIDVGDQSRREIECTDKGCRKKWPDHRCITS